MLPRYGIPVDSFSFFFADLYSLTQTGPPPAVARPQGVIDLQIAELLASQKPAAAAA